MRTSKTRVNILGWILDSHHPPTHFGWSHLLGPPRVFCVLDLESIYGVYMIHLTYTSVLFLPVRPQKGVYSTTNRDPRACHVDKVGVCALCHTLTFLSSRVCGLSFRRENEPFYLSGGKIHTRMNTCSYAIHFERN